MPAWGDFTGLNRGYVLEQYEKYRRDPSSVDAATRELFQQWTPPAADVDEPVPVSGDSIHKVVGAEVSFLTEEHVDDTIALAGPLAPFRPEASEIEWSGAHAATNCGPRR